MFDKNDNTDIFNYKGNYNSLNEGKTCPGNQFQ